MTDKYDELSLDNLFNLIKKYYLRILITIVITFPYFYLLFLILMVTIIIQTLNLT